MDQAKAEAFAGQMLGLFNGASLAMMIAIGHETRLLDRLAELAPSTSEEIAAATGMNERYIREWLGAMASGKIVEYDPATRKFWLPEEHAPFLTRAGGTNNMASFMAFFPELGRVADQIAVCFEKGGGVPYSEFTKFQTLMRDESAQTMDATLLNVTLPLVTGIVDKLKVGIDVADVGCGAGHAINLMAQGFPKSRFTGYDFSEEGIGLGKAEAAAMGLANASFEVRDAAKLGLTEAFDFITIFDAVHDQAHPAEMLKSVYGALKPGGDLLCVDVAASTDLAGNLDNPLAPGLYTISTMHCMTVSLAYGGVGLGTVWGKEKALEMFAEAGFREIAVHNVEGDIFNNYYVMRK
jgi:2-polyprenyl-3-methyl-5-hydroxy-6-metoxy-1,4-benzoquinol methylase